MANMLSTQRRGASFCDLQSAAAAGQSWAIDALTEEFLPRLVSFARVRGATDPDGIAHVAFVSVLRRLEDLQFGAKEQLWAYLCQTARSRMIDELRAAKPVDLVNDEVALHSLGADQRIVGPTSFDDRIVDRDYVDGLLSPLTNEQREVLEMRFFDDLSIEETAFRTGRSQGAVKGLQRRAINAIIAAAAVILVLIALRWTDGDDVDRLSNAPADQDPVTEESRLNNSTPVQGERSAVVVADDNTADSADGDTAGATADNTVDSATDNTAGTGADGRPDETDSTSAIDGPVDPAAAGPFTITRGSPASTEINTSGEIVPAANHGTRVYCAVSHVAHGDPIVGALGPGLKPANLYWGNTSASATSSVGELATTGNGSCEGGVNDRSAYWMPALFDSQGQVVLPEFVLVEYKTFLGPGADRSLVNEIPLGLELVADASVAKSAASFRTAGGDDRSTSFVLRFPECLMTDQGQNPVLASPEKTSHLSYSGAQTASGCPETHPYRIPQITYKLTYAVPFDSGWELATGFNGQSTNDGLVGGVIPGMSQASRDSVVRCTIELIGNCEFAASADEDGLFRSQLPDRFFGPDDSTVYRDSATLADDADRTPFGATVPPVS